MTTVTTVQLTDNPWVVRSTVSDLIFDIKVDGPTKDELDNIIIRLNPFWDPNRPKSPEIVEEAGTTTGKKIISTVIPTFSPVRVDEEDIIDIDIYSIPRGDTLKLAQSLFDVLGDIIDGMEYDTIKDARYLQGLISTYQKLWNLFDTWVKAGPLKRIQRLFPTPKTLNNINFPSDSIEDEIENVENEIFSIQIEKREYEDELEAMIDKDDIYCQTQYIKEFKRSIKALEKKKKSLMKLMEKNEEKNIKDKDALCKTIDNAFEEVYPLIKCDGWSATGYPAKLLNLAELEHKQQIKIVAESPRYQGRTSPSPPATPPLIPQSPLRSKPNPTPTYMKAASPAVYIVPQSPLRSKVTQSPIPTYVATQQVIEIPRSPLRMKSMIDRMNEN